MEVKDHATPREVMDGGVVDTEERGNLVGVRHVAVGLRARRCRSRITAQNAPDRKDDATEHLGGDAIALDPDTVSV